MKKSANPSMTDYSVLAEIKWLCRQSDFDVSERLKLLLMYLAKRVTSAPEAKISQTEIAECILNYGSDFDPISNAHVRIEMKRLRDALDLFYAKCTVTRSMRIKIPKGRYNPQLVEQVRMPTGSGPTQSNRQTIILLSLFQTDDPDLQDIAQILNHETAVRCHKSSLFKNLSYSFQTISSLSEQQIYNYDFPDNTHICMFGNIVLIGTDCCIYYSLFDTKSKNIVYRNSYKLNRTDLSDIYKVFSIADRLVMLLSDPILGIAPKLLAFQSPDSVISSLMSGYNFIASQDVQLIEPALHKLHKIQNTEMGSATAKGLLADMMRVAANLRMDGANFSTQQVIDMAEDGISIDPSNSTSRLAAGYAYLNAGNSSVAEKFSDTLVDRTNVISEEQDAILLKTLTVSEERMPLVANNFRNTYSEDFFLHDIANIVHLVRQRQLEAANMALENSAHKNNFWIHLFHVVVSSALGDQQKAGIGIRHLHRLLPNANVACVNSVSGFFLGEDREFMLEELSRLGLAR